MTAPTGPGNGGPRRSCPEPRLDGSVAKAGDRPGPRPLRQDDRAGPAGTTGSGDHPDHKPPVLAAGCVLWRRTSRGNRQLTAAGWSHADAQDDRTGAGGPDSGNSVGRSGSRPETPGEADKLRVDELRADTLRADTLEVCLVHRPRYDDWSHPKGKLKRDEPALEAAVREVLEETGQHCVVGAALGIDRYIVQNRPKQVTYWAAEATGGTFTSSHEVDRVLWLSPAAARERLTQPRDRMLVDALLRSLHEA